MLRSELVELLERVSSPLMTTLQPDNETLNVTSVSVTDDVRLTHDTNVTLVILGANFSEDSNDTWTPGDHTVNIGIRNHSAREMTWSANPTSNGSDLTVTGTPCTTSSDGNITDTNQTSNGTTGHGVMSASTEDWRSVTVDRTSSRGGPNNTTTTEAVIKKNKKTAWFPPAWFFNGSFVEHNLLEELIKKDKGRQYRSLYDAFS